MKPVMTTMNLLCATVAADWATLEVVSHYAICRSDDSQHDQALLSLEDLSFKARSKKTNITDFFSSVQ